MNIADIKPKDEVAGTYMVAESATAEARTGKEYLRITLRDREGDSILGFFFDAPPDVLSAKFTGKTVDIHARAREYQGSVNLSLKSIRPAAKQWDVTESLPKSDVSPDQMNADLERYVEGIKDPEIAAVVKAVLGHGEVAEKFERWPAAKARHHAVVGGLLQHVLELLRLADVVAELYPEVDRDLLVAGCIVHDIGKIAELGVGASFQYTAEGAMVGHIVLGDEMVARACRSVDCSPETTLRLRHMVLSHHGEKEWGSPVVPSTAEAMALHHLDQVSSQVRQTIDAVARGSKNMDESGISAWDRMWSRTWFVGNRFKEGDQSDA